MNKLKIMVTFADGSKSIYYATGGADVNALIVDIEAMAEQKVESYEVTEGGAETID